MEKVIFVEVLIIMFMMAILVDISTKGEVIFVALILTMFIMSFLAYVLIQVTVFKSRSRIGRRVKKRIFKRSDYRTK